MYILLNSNPKHNLNNLTSLLTSPCFLLPGACSHSYHTSSLGERMSDADAPDSPSKIARIAKEPLVEECLQLQQSLTELANKLEQVERSNTATLEKNKVMEQVIEDLIFKVGAVKQVGTSPATKLSPRNKR